MTHSSRATRRASAVETAYVLLSERARGSRFEIEFNVAANPRTSVRESSTEVNRRGAGSEGDAAGRASLRNQIRGIID